jgi:hypothetical protein
MFPDRKWILYSITEDDFIEIEQCIEQLNVAGLNPKYIESLALNCYACPLSVHCGVRRENIFLGARTC